MLAEVWRTYALVMGKLGDVLAAGSGLFGSIGNVISTAMTNRANMKLADHQFAQNVKMWNMQNEYNAPSAQVQRLKDAGLNPNLMYGNGNAATGNSSQMPQYAAPTLQAPQIAGNLLDFASKLEDLKTKRIGNQLTLQQMATEEAKRSELASRASKNLWDIENGNYMRVLTENKTNAEIRVMMSKLQNDASYRRQIEAEIDLTRRKILTEGMTQAQKLWEITQMQHRIREIDANVGLIKANTSYTNSRTIGQRIENYWHERGMFGSPAELVTRMGWLVGHGKTSIFEPNGTAVKPVVDSTLNVFQRLDRYLENAFTDLVTRLGQPQFPKKPKSRKDYVPRLQGAYPSYKGIYY